MLRLDKLKTMDPCKASASARSTGAVTITWIYTLVLVLMALPVASCNLQRPTTRPSTGAADKQHFASEFLDVLGHAPRDTKIPHDKIPPDKLAGSAVMRAMKTDTMDRATSGVPGQADLSAGIQESSRLAKLANISAHKPQLRIPTSSPTQTSKAQVVMVIVESLMLLVSLGCFLFTLFVGLRLQMFNPRWEHLQSAWWIGFGVALSLFGQISSLLANQMFHRSPVHLPPWMARCTQDECIGLLTLAYLLRIQTWRKAWRELIPYSSVYEQVRSMPKAGHCAPSTMLFASLTALLLLALNIPVAVGLVWSSSILWPNTYLVTGPNVVHAIDLIFPYAVLGLSASLALHALTSIRLMHDKAHELCHEIWLSCAVLCVGAILHIIFDGSWLLTYNDALDKHITPKQTSHSAALPVFRQEVSAVWCIALHLNLLVSTYFLWQSEAHCRPLPRPFDPTKVDALFEPSPLGTMKLEHESLDTESLDTESLDRIESRCNF